MSLELTLAQMLNGILNIEQTYNSETVLLGAIPELDSMAIITLITELEDHLGIQFADEDLTSENFETFGAIHDLVHGKLAG